MSKQSNKKSPALSPARRITVAGRWTLAIVGIVVILIGLDGWTFSLRLIAFALLSFLLANALWQHIPLGRACLVAFVIAGLFSAAVVLYRTFTASYDVGYLLYYLTAAAFGAVVSYPLLTLLDRAQNPKAR